MWHSPSSPPSGPAPATPNAKSIFEADRLDESTACANLLLEEAAARVDNWNHGNAVHDGHRPNMTLARELRARGQEDAVRGYLEGCRNFGRAGSGAIDPVLRFVETSTLAAIEADEEEARRRAEETREVFNADPKRKTTFNTVPIEPAYARKVVWAGEGSALAEYCGLDPTPNFRSFMTAEAKRMGFTREVRSFVAMLHGVSVRRTLERARLVVCDERLVEELRRRMESFGGGFGPG